MGKDLDKTGRGKWIQDEIKKGEWRDIKIIDADSLCDWLSLYPTVGIWMADQMGMPVEDIRPLEKYWDAILEATKIHPLSPEIFLAHRAEAKERVNQFLDNHQNRLKLTTYCPAQIPDFIAAVLQSRDDRNTWYSKTLVIDTQSAFQKMVSESGSHVFVITFEVIDEEKLISEANSREHSVIYSGKPSQNSITNSYTSTLPDIPPEYISTELDKLGYGKLEAFYFAYKCFGNPSNLRTLISGYPISPTWNLGNIDVNTILSACLFGKWDGSYEGDRKIISDFVKKPYEDWIREITNALLQSPQIPIYEENNVWKVTRKLEIWDLIWERVRAEQIQQFCKQAVQVLQEIDPKYELEPNERYMASILTKSPTYSSTLREGVADTLAFLASPLCQKNSGLDVDVQSIIQMSVREILSSPNWKLYATLDHSISLLAEASPREFLNRLRKNLKTPFIKDLIREAPNQFGPISYLPGLIWGLEKLAWSTDNLTQVIAILGDIIEMEGEPYHEKQAFRVLNTILWLPRPHTSADSKKCKAAIYSLLKNHPAIGSVLIREETSLQNKYCDGGTKPKWRGDFFGECSNVVSLYPIYCDITHYLIGNDTDFTSNLLSEYVQKNGCVRKYIVEFLENNDFNSTQQLEKHQIWLEINKALMWISRFPDNKIYSQEEVERLSAISLKLMPDEPKYKHRSLFNPINNSALYHPGILDSDASLTPQIDALKEIYSIGGISDILEFAESTSVPESVGYLFGKSAETEDDTILLPKYLTTTDEWKNKFIIGYCRGRFDKSAWQFVDSLLITSWTPNEMSVFFLSLPRMNKTWAYVSTLMGDEEKIYWEHMWPYLPKEENNWAYVLDKFLQFNLPLQAIKCISSLLFDKQKVEGEYIIGALKLLRADKNMHPYIEPYAITQILKYLAESKDINKEEIWILEVAYFSGMDVHGSLHTTIFERRLAESPEFFCEMLQLIYKSKNEQATDMKYDISIDVRNNIYYMLQHWRVIPGTRDDGTFDESAFLDWYHSVIDICQKQGLEDVAFVEIGRILTYAPEDPDGLWIHRTVANLLNEDDNESLRRHFGIGIRNKDGVHICDGEWEEQRTKNSREKADALDNAGYPLFAELMREISESYIQDKKRSEMEIRSFESF
ncbi:hypothetical protein Mlab_0982 [Methanocorpusculum labreanum Z]|uniref:Uncharacterized protein n=1 Tax=Methanocorpusculum labreanum (strain ATCC 43576 / DSM 4855 / Z) TaxID=410358 RepID=A2SS45_METLZ|nr:hypothetical protein [Methanocorpusculum labreanum]ABN07151.1 hypothetical protein Mlab_0982 [Methanocorpusculum labreanum Z]